MIGQTIFREKHRERFLSVDKAKYSTRLSAEALGLHDYLLAKPDDWVICEAHIRSRFGWGRKKYQKVMRELREAGYLRLQPIQSAAGRFIGTKYVMFEKAQHDDSASKGPFLDSEKVASTERSLLAPGGKWGSIKNNDLRLNKDSPRSPRDQAAEEIGGDAKAQQFEDEEDADSAAIRPQGQGGGEFLFAFDEAPVSAPIHSKAPRRREDSPINGGMRQRAEGLAKASVDRWNRFASEWGFIPGREDIDNAKRAFFKLSESDQELSIEGVRKMRTPPDKRCFAAKYISQKQWALSRKLDQAGESAASPYQPSKPIQRSVAGDPSRVWVEQYSRQWDAWSTYLAAQGEPPRVAIQTRRGPGNNFPSNWPPGHPMDQPAVSLRTREDSHG